MIYLSREEAEVVRFVLDECFGGSNWAIPLLSAVRQKFISAGIHAARGLQINGELSDGRIEKLHGYALCSAVFSTDAASTQEHGETEERDGEST